MMLTGGGLQEDVVAAAGTVSVRYAKCEDGWSAEFSITAPGVDDLEVMHRLTAPSLGEVRRLVPSAVAFLHGAPVDPLG